MKPRSGMTLVEVQVASLLMAVILVAMGVVMVTVLNQVRILQDAHTVYWNALAAMKALQMEIMRSNRYGWNQGIAYAVPDGSLYGIGGSEETRKDVAPSLNGTNNGTELYLRADGQAGLGEPAADAQSYQNDVRLHFYLGGGDGTDLIEEVNGVARTIATHVRGMDINRNPISGIRFSKLTYNAVAVTVIVQGDLPDDADTGGPPVFPKHEALISTIVNLRCAAAESPESRAGYAGQFFW